MRRARPLESPPTIQSQRCPVETRYRACLWRRSHACRGRAARAFLRGDSGWKREAPVRLGQPWSRDSSRAHRATLAAGLLLLALILCLAGAAAQTTAATPIAGGQTDLGRSCRAARAAGGRQRHRRVRSSAGRQSLRPRQAVRKVSPWNDDTAQAHADLEQGERRLQLRPADLRRGTSSSASSTVTTAHLATS